MDWLENGNFCAVSVDGGARSSGDNNVNGVFCEVRA
jgi:hypothetical protein